MATQTIMPNNTSGLLANRYNQQNEQTQQQIQQQIQQQSQQLDKQSDQTIKKRKIHIMSSEELLMNTLTRFFSNSKNMGIMLPIISQKAKISLRILDHFVTNLSKRKGTWYMLNGKPFTVYLHYKAILKRFSKEKFDSFCRGERILFMYNETEKIETTVGQLNFFKWVIQNGILDYVVEHLEEIELDMKTYSNIRRNLKKLNKRAKKIGNPEPLTLKIDNKTMAYIPEKKDKLYFKLSSNRKDNKISLSKTQINKISKNLVNLEKNMNDLDNHDRNLDQDQIISTDSFNMITPINLSAKRTITKRNVKIVVEF